ncbi:hypothetical protein ABPG75_014035 [Micractinium tetrahymenae]
MLGFCALRGNKASFQPVGHLPGTPPAAHPPPPLRHRAHAAECSGRRGRLAGAVSISCPLSSPRQTALWVSALGFALHIAHMLRRAAPRLLGRLLAIEGGLLVAESKAALLPAAARSVQQSVSAAAAARGFRSSAAGSSSLAEALRNEVNYEKENYEQPPEVCAGPPAGFTLTESRGDTLMTLTKKHGAETVTVDVMVNDQPEEELVQDEESGAVDADVGVVFTAAVTKGGRSLVFECKSDGQYLEVLHASLEPAEGEVEDSAYTGPVYEELDEELQAQFEEYLAERGITQELGAYLLPLVHDKEQREYMGWLEGVETFVRQ